MPHQLPDIPKIKNSTFENGNIAHLGRYSGGRKKVGGAKFHRGSMAGGMSRRN
jgi:hypothetical protein